MILDILTILFLVSGWVLILIMILERRRDVLHGPSIKNNSKKARTNLPAWNRNLAATRSAPNVESTSDEYTHLVQGIEAEIERRRQASFTPSRTTHDAP
jgi:hypothetical protein